MKTQIKLIFAATLAAWGILFSGCDKRAEGIYYIEEDRRNPSVTNYVVCTSNQHLVSYTNLTEAMKDMHRHAMSLVPTNNMVPEPDPYYEKMLRR